MRNSEAICRLEDCLGVKRIDKAYLVLSGAVTCRRFLRPRLRQVTAYQSAVKPAPGTDAVSTMSLNS